MAFVAVPGITSSITGVASSGDGLYRIAVSADGFVFRSSDSGITWNTATTVSSTYRTTVSMSSSGQHVLIACYGSTLYTSDDYGASFTSVESTRDWWSVAIDSNGMYQLAAVYGGELYLSSNNGSTWSPIGIGDKLWRGTAINSNGSIMYALTYDGSIYKSINYGTTWDSLVVPPFESNFYSVCTNANGAKVAYSTWDGNGYAQAAGTIYSSDNGGSSWAASVDLSNTGGYCEVSMSGDGNYLLAVSQAAGKAMVTLDNGVTWSTAASEIDLTDVLCVSVKNASNPGCVLFGTGGTGQIYQGTALDLNPVTTTTTLAPSSATSFFSNSSVADGTTAISTVSASYVASLCNADPYLDTVGEIARVVVYYTHQDGRQKKRLIHNAPAFTSSVKWSAFAKDGDWLKAKVRVMDFEGAERDLYRTDFGTGEDLIHSGGVMLLNTYLSPTTTPLPTTV